MFNIEKKNEFIANLKEKAEFLNTFLQTNALY